MNKWRRLRSEFKLDRDVSHFATLVLASHPRAVSQEIRTYRDGLDKLSHAFFTDNSARRRNEVLAAVAEYCQISPGLIALTHSTTVGLAQVIGGMRVAPGQEILTSRTEHPATTETLQLRAERDGTPFRQVALYRDSRTVSADEILQNLRAEIRPWTRLLTLTWVSSTDGVKLPLKAVSALVAEENQRRRYLEDRLLFVVDGVHGFGIEAMNFQDLGCDFFVAGTHKGILGPRGTGLILGKTESWSQVVPFVAKLSGANDGPASRHVPGGVKAYDHWWALSAAFAFHTELGKADVQLELHRQAKYLKDRLQAVGCGVVLVTPDSMEFSSAIVCIDLPNMTPPEVTRRLLAVGVLVSETPWDAAAARTHVRIGVSLATTDEEIDHLIDCIRALAAGEPLPPRPDFS